MPNTEPDCIFCKIAAHQAPAHWVYEDAQAFAILDINPLSRGHCLVLPKRHVPYWYEMTAEETASVFNAARIVANRMIETLGCELVTTYARGRRIPHTHIFLVPTFGGDLLDRYFNTLERIQESPPDLARLRENQAMEETARILKSK